eukprot:TRINITY_DN97304_c0_g1_i1.p1 TRINITY_DN97304_c0_g1~~TRINITY_DN97304_c0_g1_i1.p1  ORF type:complete len:536 (+),score=112.60 TRINITY_DN97304_c0_g1_i1:102-1709(+)
MPIDAAAKAAELRQQLGPKLTICVLGGTSFQGSDSEALTSEVALQLGKAFGSRANFITGGLSGVQETFAKSCGSECSVWNLVPEGGTCAFSIGQTLHAGANMDERKAIFAHLGDVYLTVEGGPGVAEEARTAFSRGAAVVPLIRTGGASGGMFGFPSGALKRPAFVGEERWSLLSDKSTPPAWQGQVAATVVAIVAGYLRGSSSAAGRSLSDRQETHRLESLQLQLAVSQAPPWLAPYLEKLEPALRRGSEVLSVVGPFIYRFYAGLYRHYKALPHEAANCLWGLGQCFFGGRYVAFFAASAAFKSAGGDNMLLSLQDLKADAVAVLEANAKQEEVTGHGTSPSEKFAIVMRTVDPNRISTALGCLWSGYMGIVMALKFKFARTVALAHSIGDNLRPMAAKMLAPTALAVTPPEYQQWIPPAINLSCQAIAMSIAWKLQQVVSSVQCGIAGGLLASRCGLNCSVPLLQERGLVGSSLNLEVSKIDDVLGYSLAAAGIYYQLWKGGSPPVYLLPITWPIGLAESWLQWSVTWMAKE